MMKIVIWLLMIAVVVCGEVRRIERREHGDRCGERQCEEPWPICGRVCPGSGGELNCMSGEEIRFDVGQKFVLEREERLDVTGAWKVYHASWDEWEKTESRTIEGEGSMWCIQMGTSWWVVRVKGVMERSTTTTPTSGATTPTSGGTTTPTSGGATTTRTGKTTRSSATTTTERAKTTRRTRRRSTETTRSEKGGGEIRNYIIGMSVMGVVIVGMLVGTMCYRWCKRRARVEGVRMVVFRQNNEAYEGGSIEDGDFVEIEL